MGAPWNNWFHCICSTYGSWLPGDPRGFRTWQHRQHVDGDYRRPPPKGKHDDVLKRSRAQMKRPRVLLSPAQRESICRATADRLVEYDIEFIDLCVSAMHLHLLTRFRRLDGSYRATIPRLPTHSALRDGRDPWPRHIVGLLKKHATHQIRLAWPDDHRGGIWAQRGKIIPINDRAHQLEVVAYIRKHAAQGAAVWSILKRWPRDGR
jgi:hypothetical protein